MVFIKKYLLYLALIIAIAATIISLYFSEVLHFTPCILCWYQRILMYPQIILITVGILRKDQKLYFYVLPLSILGALIAFYHELLQIGLLPEAITPCTLGVSCVTKYINYFGFITMPVMSLTAFSAITICMLLYKSFQGRTKK